MTDSGGYLTTRVWECDCVCEWYRVLTYVKCVYACTFPTTSFLSFDPGSGIATPLWNEPMTYK